MIKNLFGERRKRNFTSTVRIKKTNERVLLATSNLYLNLLTALTTYFTFICLLFSTTSTETTSSDWTGIVTSFWIPSSDGCRISRPTAARP